MHIHIGNKKTVSSSSLIGIFNKETLVLSEDNSNLLDKLDGSAKTIAVDENNNITVSSVSPFTIIKRTDVFKDSLWRK